MKTLISIFVAVIFLTAVSVLADDSSSLKPTTFIFATNAIEYENTNLVVFGPPYGTNPPANIPEMLATNGLECLVEVSLNRVFVLNHATNYMACLRMPVTNLLRVVLLDKEGHQVKKTALGKMYGWPLSQEQIDYFRHHWNTRHQSIFLNLFPAGLESKDSTGKIVQDIDDPTEICYFSFKDAFEITSPGEYELHLQLRLVQVGTDSSGKFHYPVTWLPEVTAKVQIRPEDIVPTNSISQVQTNSLPK